jgi:hypothetical protein
MIAQLDSRLSAAGRDKPCPYSSSANSGIFCAAIFENGNDRNA